MRRIIKVDTSPQLVATLGTGQLSVRVTMDPARPQLSAGKCATRERFSRQNRAVSGIQAPLAADIIRSSVLTSTTYREGVARSYYRRVLLREPAASALCGHPPLRVACPIRPAKCEPVRTLPLANMILGYAPCMPVPAETHPKPSVLAGKILPTVQYHAVLLTSGDSPDLCAAVLGFPTYRRRESDVACSGAAASGACGGVGYGTAVPVAPHQIHWSGLAGVSAAHRL